MAYKSEPRQKAAQQRDEASATTSAQRKANTSFVDKRASATSQLQLKAMMEASPRHASLRNLKQLMTNHAGLDTAPVQKQANEELLQARFATAQLAKDDELLQGKFEPAQRAKDEELMQGKFATTQLAKEEELLQGKFEPVQRVKEEDLLQGKFETAQLAKDEELLQGKFETVQRVKEEDPLQGKFEAAQLAKDEELLQGKFEPVQRVVEGDPLQGKFETVQLAKDEELLQGKFASTGATTQLQQASAIANDTGLPKQLKAGVEALSGMSLDHVKVHYNSAQPAQMQAHAYAQGSDIHLAPGQEKHLPHEAWHVVQQAQGRVKPTLQMKGTAVNDDVGLETEADVMGAKAQVLIPELHGEFATSKNAVATQLQSEAKPILQRKIKGDDSEVAKSWNAKVLEAADWDLGDSISDYVGTVEGLWHGDNYNKQAALTTLVYKIKARLTKLYEIDEDDAADLDWDDMEDFLNKLAANGEEKCLSIVWLGAMGGHNNKTWKVKGLKNRDELMGSIALDSHSRGKGNKNLAPAQKAVKSAAKIYNTNLALLIGEI